MKKISQKELSALLINIAMELNNGNPENMAMISWDYEAVKSENWLMIDLRIFAGGEGCNDPVSCAAVAAEIGINGMKEGKQ